MALFQALENGASFRPDAASGGNVLMNGEWIGANKKRCPWVDALLGYGAWAAFQPPGRPPAGAFMQGTASATEQLKKKNRKSLFFHNHLLPH